MSNAAKVISKSRASAEPSVSVTSMDAALNEQRVALFQAMGIVRLAAGAVREPADQRSAADAWTALEAAHTILSGVADRMQDTESMLAEEVRHGDY